VASFLINRFAQGFAVVVLASILVFLAMRLIPGDPAALLAGQDATPADVEAVRERLGLNDSLVVQYGNWLGGVLQGNFGESFSRGIGVNRLMSSAALPSAELAVAGYFFALVVGLPLGIFAGLKPGGGPDYLATGFTMFTLGIPNFVLGIILIWVLGVVLDVFPITGRVAITEDPIEAIKFLVMPMIAVGAGTAAVLARFVRASIIETLNQDYVRTARAKGLRERGVVLRHAMRNALIPVITVAALQIGFLISGAVIVEVVFARPGFGSLIITAVQGRDYQLIQGMLVVLVTVFVVVNVLADIAYGLADPRIRVQ
jgi:peptide/nickel transport system permease protein